jgi:excisionase family DNA binding protein
MVIHESELCTVAEAARMLHVSKPTLWRWIEAGRLASIRLGPRSIRIRRTELDRFADAGAHEGARPWWERYVTRLGDPDVPEEELMARIEAINDQILGDRGGLPLDDSLAEIHEVRRERDEQW